MDLCDDVAGVLVFTLWFLYVVGFFLGTLRYWLIQDNGLMQSGHTSFKENALAGIGQPVISRKQKVSPARKVS